VLLIVCMLVVGRGIPTDVLSIHTKENHITMLEIMVRTAVYQIQSVFVSHASCQTVLPEVLVSRQQVQTSRPSPLST
jgi:hypothetical protein